MPVIEFKHALRSLTGRHNRAFTLASVLMLALGIAAVTTIFSVLYAVLLAPLPYRDPEAIFSLAESKPSAGLDAFSVSALDYQSWTERARGYAGLSAYYGSSANLGGPDGAERVESVSATPNLWEVLGLPLRAGRSFSAAEDSLNATAVIVGEGLWQRRYGRDPTLLGRTISVDGIERTVIGIAPQDAGFTSGAEIWLPLAVRDQPWGRGDRRVNVLARLAPGTTRAIADAEMRAIAAQLSSEFPDDNRDWSVVSIPVRDWLVGAPLRARVLMLSGAVLLLLLVACINVANLQIARATTREREIGVRQALGATRARLMRQIVGECLVLAGLGGAIGIALAAAAIRIVASGALTALPRLQSLSLDWPVALAAIAATSLTAVACGLAPAVFAARSQVAAALQSAGRSATEIQRTPLRQILVVVQFALATLLVVASALLVQQFRAIQANTLGFQTDHVLSARITLPDDDNGTNQRRNSEAYQRLLEEVRAMPGVEKVGLGSEVPLGQVNTTSMQIAVGTSVNEARNGGAVAAWRVVSGDFLDALGVPILRGRSFAATGEPRHSMLLSAGLAHKLWPAGEDPIGRSVTLSNGQNYQIVGVVGDVRLLDRAAENTPTMYMPTTWAMLSTMTLALRVRNDPAASIAALRDVARRVIPEYPLFDIDTMDSVAAANVAEPRAQTAVVTLFGIVSLLLAAIGIAGVTAFLVARRTPELAVRMALGATAARVVRHVIARGGALCMIGVAVGMLLVAALTRASGGLLAAPAANVTLTLVAVAAFLSAAGLIACWIPARRAASISPSLALRGD